MPSSKKKTIDSDNPVIELFILMPGSAIALLHCGHKFNLENGGGSLPILLDSDRAHNCPKHPRPDVSCADTDPTLLVN